MGQGCNSSLALLFWVSVGLQSPLCPCGRQGTEHPACSAGSGSEEREVWGWDQCLKPACRCFKPENFTCSQISLVRLGWKCSFVPPENTDVGCEAVSVMWDFPRIFSLCCLHREHFPFSGSWSDHEIVEWFGLGGT